MDRVTDPADPRRCLAPDATGQCWGVKVEGSDYCETHAGMQRLPAPGMYDLLLAKARDRARLAMLSESDHIKSLRDSIGMARLMLEETWNAAGSTDAERQLMFSKVRLYKADMERTIKLCFELEERLGSLLSKPTLLRVGRQICEALVKRLANRPGYEQVVDVLIDDVSTIIQEARNESAAVPALPAPGK